MMRRLALLVTALIALLASTLPVAGAPTAAAETSRHRRTTVQVS